MQLLRKLGFPISLIYALIVYVRNRFYDLGWFSGKSYATKTICVGNLSVGGTGKTPMIEFLITNLKESNKIAVLSRGYGRKSKGFLMAGPDVGVGELGDEPYQIARKFPGITVAVDIDRQHGIDVLESTVGPDVILMDDAFQHRKVNCERYILLTSYGHLYVDDWYLPTGNLRDSKREAKRAHLIVVTKCPKDLDRSEQEIIRKKLNPLPHQVILFSYLEYSSRLKGFGEMGLEELKGRKVTLVTGIANPAPLVRYLESQGLILEHLSYRDHHFFSEREIGMFAKKEMVLTTEKDYVRLEGRVDHLYYISIKHIFMADGNEVMMKRLA